MYTKPERDPTYHCEGVQMYVHYVKGWENNRHVRVSLAMQMGKDILMQNNGHLCFYATRGIGNKKKVMQSAIKGMLQGALLKKATTAAARASILKPGTVEVEDKGKESPEAMMVFNDDRTWYKDLYNLIWDMDLEENVYIIIQILERKPNLEPSKTQMITR